MKSSFRQSSTSKKTGLISVMKCLAGFWGACKGKENPSQGYGRRHLVLESLENRELLSVSVAEFDQIRSIYSDFGLSESMAEYNVVEVEAGNVELLRDAVTQSHGTQANELIVIRADSQDLTNNVLDLGSSPIFVNLTQDAGSLTIVGLGETLPQITGTSNSLISVMSGDVQLGGLSLTGKACDNIQAVSDLIWEGGSANISTSRMLYSAADSNGLYAIDFMVSENEGAFLTGASDAELERYSEAISVASSERYYVGVFYDAEKTGVGDSLLCWAGSASNMLYYTGWANEDLGFSDEDDVFDYFKSHFSDAGGQAYYGIDWFLTGDYYPAIWSSWSQPTSKGGAFYPSVNFTDVCTWVDEGSTMVATAASGLQNHCGVGVGLGWYPNGYNSDRSGGHAITAWGYIYDTSVDETNPAYYTSLLLSDSDDNYGMGRSAPNVLTAKPIIWDASANTYELDYDLNSSTHDAWLENFAILQAHELPVKPSVYVNTTSDIVDPYDGYISLREAVTLAEKLATSDNTIIIAFDEAIQGQTITLTSEITISKGIAIDGELEDGTAGITISGNDLCRIFNISTSASVTLNGLNFEHGNSGRKDGGAIYAVTTKINTTLEITNCQFSNNFTKASGGAVFSQGYILSVSDSQFDFNSSQVNGGAIYELGPQAGTSEIATTTFNQNWAYLSGGAVYAKANITVSSSDFLNNTAQASQGGGLYLASDPSKTLTASVTSNLFLNNTAGSDGGAVYSAVSTSFATCNLSGNTAAGNGGAIFMSDSAPGKFSSCYVLANTAANSGGGIYTQAALECTWSRIDDNIAGGQGGGLYTTTSITMVSTFVRQNSATGDGAGIAMTETGTYLFKNSEISQNTTKANGGGLSMSFGQTGIIVNCTIVANTASSGGGLYLVGGANVYNSIVVENQGEDIVAATGGVVGKYSLSAFTNWAEEESCTVYEAANRDRVFANFDKGNYRPSVLSPTLDAGNTRLYATNGPAEAYDLAGRQRTVLAIDIGAYEFYYSNITLAAPYSLAVQYDASSKENSVVLSWKSPNTASAFLVQWSTSSDFESVQEVYVGKTDSLNVPGLLSFTNYYFRVKAIGTAQYCDSEWSSSVSVDIKGEVKLSAPKVFTGQKESASSVLITWNPVRCALKYRLEYSTSPRFADGVTESVVFESAGTQTITGLSANTTCFFRIKALGNGEDVFDSDWSSSIYVVTLAELAVPTLTSATVLGCTSVDFVLAPQEDALSYVVQYCVAPESGEFDETNATSLDEYSNAFVVEGLTPDTQYLFRFQAKAKQGLADSAWSSVTEYTTSNTLAVPVISSAKSETIDSVKLEWLSVELASQYIVEYKVNTKAETDQWTPLPELGSNVLTTTVSGLTSNTSYTFRVKATNGSQIDSDYFEIQVKTQANTDVILDKSCVAPTKVSTLVGTFKKNDCLEFKLVAASGTNNNDLFKIEVSGDEYQLWTSGSLDKGTYVVEVRGAASEADLDKAKTKTQQLVISVYQPEVIANADVIYTSENGNFSLSGIRKDMRDPNMTYQWVDASGSVIKEGQTVDINVSTDLNAVADETDARGDTFKSLILRGTDANGMTSQDYNIKVYTSKDVTPSGTVVDTSYLDDSHICKINLTITGANASTWYVNWGDNTESKVTVCSRDMSFVHYYARANTYQITYSITSLAGTEYLRANAMKIVVSNTTPVTQDALADEVVLPGTNDVDQESVVEEVIAAVAPEDEFVVSDNSVVLDTQAVLSRVAFEPKAIVSQTGQHRPSLAVALGENPGQNDSTLRDSELENLAIDFVQQKYKRSTGLPGLTSTDQFFATLEDDTFV